MRLLEAATLCSAASDGCGLMGWATSGFSLLNSDLSGNLGGARGLLAFLLNYGPGHSGRLPKRCCPRCPSLPCSSSPKQAGLQCPHSQEGTSCSLRTLRGETCSGSHSWRWESCPHPNGKFKWLSLTSAVPLHSIQGNRKVSTDNTSGPRLVDSLQLVQLSPFMSPGSLPDARYQVL